MNEGKPTLSRRELLAVFATATAGIALAACASPAAPAPTKAPEAPKPAATTPPAPAAPAPTTALAAPAPTTAPAAVKWPTRNVVFVTHTNPGAGGDLFNRAMAKPAEKVWGVSVAVENRAGASGANALIYVKSQKPDGYTLLGITPTIISAPMTSKMPVSDADFTPVCRMVIDIMVLYTRYDAPYQNAKDIVADAKANPGKQKWGGGAVGSTDNYMCDQAIKSAGIQVEYVPFESGAEVITAVAGGHVTAGAGEYGEIIPQIDAKKLKVLGVAANARLPGVDTPTLKEQGIDSVLEKFRGVFVVKGTPMDIVEAIAAACKKVYDTPEFQNWANTNHIALAYQGPADFAKSVENDHKVYQGFMDRLGIKPK